MSAEFVPGEARGGRQGQQGEDEGGGVHGEERERERLVPSPGVTS